MSKKDEYRLAVTEDPMGTMLKADILHGDQSVGFITFHRFGNDLEVDTAMIDKSARGMGLFQEAVLAVAAIPWVERLYSITSARSKAANAAWKKLPTVKVSIYEPDDADQVISKSPR